MKTKSEQLKQILREEMRKALRTMSPEERRRESLQVSQAVLEAMRLRNAVDSKKEVERVALFHPLPHEIDVTSLMQALPGCTFYFPKCGEERSLTFHRVEDCSLDMEEGFYGIFEPRAHCESLSEGDMGLLDVILVPGLAFTDRGERMGRGGGYYDRFLERVHHVSERLRRSKNVCGEEPRRSVEYWGVGFACQRVDKLPLSEHDFRMDRVFLG